MGAAAVRLPSVLLWIALAAFTTGAQAQPLLDGTWKATFATEGSEGREATVTIDGLTGSWTTHARSTKDKKDVCVGRPLPMTLLDSGSSTVTLRVDASTVVQGCRDRKARLTRVDARTLEGEFDNGRVLRLVRD